jgi:6-phospho-beta-glucosidase
MEVGHMVTTRFPNAFWWGAATSGPQAEGRFHKQHKNVFDHWYDVEPQAFFNAIGPNVASNFYHTYVEDIKMMKEIGLNSFRTSIQWTRLIKDFETAEPDPDAIRYYNAVIEECLKNGITPVMTLHHFDLPVELYDKYGGWTSKHVVELFTRFAAKCFELFADRVKYWATFNEPGVVIEGQYLYQFHYPCLVDGKQAVQAAYNINLASAKAVQAFKDGYYDKTGGKIGMVINLTPSYPRSEEANDIKAAQIADLFFNRLFLDPAVKGEFPGELVDLFKQDDVLWESTAEELEIIKQSRVDFLGVNYYFPRRIKAKEEPMDESHVWTPDKYFDHYEMPGRRMNPHRGWEIYPKAIYDIAVNLKENYNNISWYVSENGMGVEGEEKFKDADGVIQDDYRIEFVQEHLEWLNKGIQEGSNCFGYHMWTPIDCWSWKNAYKNRYGFIALDLATQTKTMKKSGRWIKEVAKNNGF